MKPGDKFLILDNYNLFRKEFHNKIGVVKSNNESVIYFIIKAFESGSYSHRWSMNYTQLSGIYKLSDSHNINYLKLLDIYE